MKSHKLVLMMVMMCFVCVATSGVWAQEQEQPLVSTLFFMEDIREAINELVLQTGINIIYDETVRGIVTLDLIDVPLEKALDMMLLAGGFTYQKIDDFYLVGLPDPRSPIFQHLVTTERIQLQYITAADARALLPQFYDNYLRSVGTEYAMTVTAPAHLIERLKNDLAKIDVPRHEVLIKAIVTELSMEALEDLGATLFGWSTTGFPSWDSEGLFSIGLPSPGNISLGAGLFGTLEARLRAMEQNDLADVRANPTVRVIDRNTANRFVGDTRYIFLTPEGAPTRLEQVDVGVSLNVTPRILDNDRIQLTVSPEISHVTDERREDLVVRRSEISTTLFLQNGQTAMLAGMTVNEVLEQERKVPILGDIPLLRLLFRQTTERVSERELLVFITAEIIEMGNQ